jgi:hypothetical protein
LESSLNWIPKRSSSKLLAARFRNEGRDEPDLAIVVLNESGREIHREPVHPATSTQP